MRVGLGAFLFLLLVSCSGDGEKSITQTGGATKDTNVLTLSGISVSASSSNNLPIGINDNFTATATYSDGSQKDITEDAVWSSSAPLIATVSNLAPHRGQVTGVALGSAIITATLDGYVGSASLTVVNATLLSMAFKPASQNISTPKGRKPLYEIDGEFSDGITRAVEMTASLSASDPSKVSFLANEASTLAEGTVTITASLESISITTSLTITPKVLDSIVIDPVHSSISLAKGQTHAYSIIPTYSDQTHLPLPSVSWTTSDALAASFTADEVTALSTIAATVDVSASVTIGPDTFLAPPVTLALTPAVVDSIVIDIADSNQQIAKGLVKVFHATGNMSDGTTQDISATATWSSSDTNIASLLVNVASTLQVGVTTITVTKDSAIATTNLEVLPPTLVSISVTPGNPDLPNGGTLQLTATGTYTDASTADLSNLAVWTSSHPERITVDSTGLTTWVARGGATISATYSGFVGVSYVNALKVICTELYTQGLLPQHIWEADVSYSRRYIDDEARDNYHAWGVPVAKWMSQSASVTQFVQPFAVAWANQMAYEMGAGGQSSLLGKSLVKFGLPISNGLGRVIRTLNAH